MCTGLQYSLLLCVARVIADDKCSLDTIAHYSVGEQSHKPQSIVNSTSKKNANKQQNFVIQFVTEIQSI